MPCWRQSAGDAQVEIRRIGQDGEIGLAARRRPPAVCGIRRRSAECAPPLRAGRPPPGWRHPPRSAHARGAQPRSGAAEKFGIGENAPQLLHHQRGVQVARGLSGRHQDLGHSFTVYRCAAMPIGQTVTQRISARHRNYVSPQFTASRVPPCYNRTTGMSTEAEQSRLTRGRTRYALSRRDDSAHQQILLLLARCRWRRRICGSI